jgi:hypothetical protein
MGMNKIIFAMFFVVSLLLSCDRTSLESKQTEVIRKFYTMVLSLKDDGVPSRQNIDRLTPYISVQFSKNLIDARNAEDRALRHQKKISPEPPLIEGSLFFSLFEGADRIADISPEKNKKSSYLVAFEYRDSHNKETVSWKDRVILADEHGSWKVDDLEFLSDWQFGLKGRLSTILQSVARFDHKE